MKYIIIKYYFFRFITVTIIRLTYGSSIYLSPAACRRTRKLLECWPSWKKLLRARPRNLYVRSRCANIVFDGAVFFRLADMFNHVKLAWDNLKSVLLNLAIQRRINKFAVLFRLADIFCHVKLAWDNVKSVLPNLAVQRRINKLAMQSTKCLVKLKHYGMVILSTL